jgi:hypothetical protein
MDRWVCLHATHFVLPLPEMWKRAHTCTGAQQAIESEARQLVGAGICQVLALLSESDRQRGFEELLSFPQKALEQQSAAVDETKDETVKKDLLKLVAGEIQLIACLCRSFTNAGTSDYGSMESGCPSSPDRRELVSSPVMTVVRRSWTRISQLASNYALDEVCVSCDVGLCCRFGFSFPPFYYSTCPEL